MDEVIEQLLKLQEIDSMVAELEKKRALVPKRLAEERAHLDTAKAQVVACKEQIREKEKERRAAEKEVEEIGEMILRYQTQLNAAKTNEEYRALLVQIERARERQSHVEDRVLALMVELEQLEQTLKAVQATEQTAQHRYDERERELDMLRLRLEEGISVKSEERQRVASTLDQTTLKRYERILAGKDGLAVAVVDGYICGGCHGTLPPQTVNEIRKREKLYTCQFCGRILVTRAQDDGLHPASGTASGDRLPA